MRAYLTLKMNRPVQARRDYISPGGYHFKDENGKEWGMDFNASEAFINKDDPSIIDFVLSDPDLVTFPEMTEAFEKAHTFTEITDFYVFTGEEKPFRGICPVKIISFSLEEGYEIYDFPRSLLDTWSFEN